MKNLILLFAATFIFGSQYARAQSTTAGGIVFNPSFFYYMDNDNNAGGNKTDTTRDVINLKLGYLMAQGFYFGLAYDIDNKSVNNGNSTTNSDRKSYGGTVGFVYNGWQFLGTYYLSSELDVGSNTYKGTGWDIDVGYVFNVGSIGIGPVLTYRSWSYSKLNGNSLSPSENQANVFPMLQFFVTF